MRKYIDDIFIFIGSALVIYATYRINLTAALFVGGFLFIAFGILFGLTGKKVSK